MILQFQAIIQRNWRINNQKLKVSIIQKTRLYYIAIIKISNNFVITF